MAVLFSALVVYIYTLFGCVAPYRDTGEMVSVAHTLGIAHPPGYPLYTLISKISILLLPFASEGYRLNALSALGGAVTAWLFYRILLALSIRKLTAGLLSLVFAFSYLQWYLSLVSEMYTLNTMVAAALILLLLEINRRLQKGDAQRGKAMLYFAAFILGAGLGVRMDVLLAAPAALVVLYARRKNLNFSDLLYAGLFFTAGFSVFLYLPFRSHTLPFLDWNHPATLERLWGSLARKTHGGTLDLVSAPYASGANFAVCMKFYFKHLFNGFAYVGSLLFVLGAYSLFKREKVICHALSAGWLFCGPVFIYLANMPPNPHALAILEAHFLLPNLFAAVFIAEGVVFAAGLGGPAGAKFAAPVMAALMLAVQLFNGVGALNKRENLVAYDYSKNVLRSLPPDSVVVMKKDVQLFALWNRQYVEGDRQDCAVVGQGLSGSAWYQAAYAKFKPGVRLCALRDTAGWLELMKINPGKNIYFSPDVEYARPAGYTEAPAGLLCMITQKQMQPREDVLMSRIYPYRGSYLYGDYSEFFTPDLIEDYSRARVSLARYYMDKGKAAEARYQLDAAVSLQPFSPQVYVLMGYLYFNENKLELAARNYLTAASQYKKMLGLARQYNALEDVMAGIGRDAAEVYISLGVCSEKMDKGDEGLSYYSEALEIYPSYTKAYFNRAVIYWKRSDWQSVIRELEQALRIDPNYAEAAYYLQMAKQKAQTAINK